MSPRTLKITLFLLLALLFFPESGQSFVGCNKNWVGGDGNFSDGSKYVEGTAPEDGDSVCILVDDNYTVTVDSAAALVQLTLGDSGNSGTQNLNVMTGGILNLGGLNLISHSGVVTNWGNITCHGGSIEVGGVVENAGVFDLQLQDDICAVDGTGTFENAPGAALQKSGGTGEVFIGDGGVLNFVNRGRIFAGAGTIRIRWFSHQINGELSAASGAEVRLDGGSHIFEGTTTGTADGQVVIAPFSSGYCSGDCTFNIVGTGLRCESCFFGGDGRITNLGMLTLDGGPAGPATLHEATLDNQATVELNGQVELDGAGIENYNVVRLTSDGALRLASFAVAPSRLDNAGTIEKTGGSGTFTFFDCFPVSYDCNNTGTIDVQSGTIRVEGDSTHQNATLTTAPGAAIEFSGNVEVGGALSGNAEGNIKALSGSTVECNDVEECTLDVSGEGFHCEQCTFDGDPWTNTGRLEVALPAEQNAQITNAPTGQLTHICFEGQSSNLYILNADLENQGSHGFQCLAEVGLQGTGNYRNIGGSFSNDGAGTVLLQIPMSDTGGSIQAQGGDISTQLLLEIHNSTLSAAAGRTLRLNGPVTAEGIISGGGSGNLVIDTIDTVLGSNAIWDLTGNGLRVEQADLAGSHTNTGNVAFATGGSKTLADFGTFLNGLPSPSTVTGTVSLQPDTTLILGDGASITNNSGSNVVLEGDNTVTGSGSIINDGGAIQKSGGGTATIGVPVDNLIDGNIDLVSGTFDFNNILNHDQGAVIQGTDTIDVVGATVSNDGRVCPGALNWVGPYNPSATAVLCIELGGYTPGSQHDQLVVDGAAALAGNLEVTLTDGFVPYPGDSFTILTASSGVSGAFTNPTVDLGDGRVLQVTYNANDVTLVAPSLTADAGGPYTAAGCRQEITFDGSGSQPSSPSNPIVSYHWDFGDGTEPLESPDPNITHSYNNPGSYEATLTVFDDNDDSASDTALVEVAYAPPEPNAGGPHTANEGSAVTFDGSSTGCGSSLAYAWDFGDGSPLMIGSDLTNPQHTYADNEVYMVTLTVRDDSGGEGSNPTVVIVDNVAPTIQTLTSSPAQPNEGDEVTLSTTISDPGADDSFTVVYNWGDDSSDGQTLPAGATSFQASRVYADNGIYTVSLTVTDDDGGISTASLSVSVTNVAPTVDVGGDATVSEGASFNRSGSFTDPGADDTHTGTMDYGDGSGTQALALNPDKTFDLNHTYGDEGTYTATVCVSDGDGGQGCDSFTVTITPAEENVTPAIDAFTAPIDPININDQPVIATVAFSDPDEGDMHTVELGWGDGITDTVENASSPLSLTHTYSAPNVYTLQLRVTDNQGISTSQSYEFIVIYDPAGGFVTGGGWIDSPAGAYLADPALSGMANFGFFSKYQQGANAPTGNTHFNFRVGNLSFDSDSYDWLVVNQGGNNAKFKGSGTINGELAPGGVPYKFLIWATDGAPDTFRIKIWYEDENGEEIGIYDNGTVQPIGAGSINVQ